MIAHIQQIRYIQGEQFELPFGSEIIDFYHEDGEFTFVYLHPTPPRHCAAVPRQFRISVAGQVMPDWCVYRGIARHEGHVFLLYEEPPTPELRATKPDGE